MNALIHADHFGQGTVVIEKYRDRFEFSNPGSLLISLDQLLNGNVSEQRLVASKILLQDGQGRWTRYRLPPENHYLHTGVDSLHINPVSLHISSTLHSSEAINNQEDELLKIAELARQSSRLTTKQMESILLRLCEKHWLTRKKIAELLDRNEEGLRSRFLAPMVEHGLLRLRYPDKPNRADQAYTKNVDAPIKSK